MKKNNKKLMREKKQVRSQLGKCIEKERGLNSKSNVTKK